MSTTPPLHNRLVHSVRLEVPNHVTDGAGGFETSWVLLKQVFAEVVPAGSSSVSGGVHVQPTLARYRLTLYPDAAISLPLRVIWKNRALKVNSIEDHHDHIVLQAETEISQ